MISIFSVPSNVYIYELDLGPEEKTRFVTTMAVQYSMTCARTDNLIRMLIWLNCCQATIGRLEYRCSNKWYNNPIIALNYIIIT